MKILIVTTEIGENGGGLSLSCSRVSKYLGTSHDVSVISSVKESIPTALGGYSKKVQVSIQREYNLKQDLLNYSYYDLVIGFGGGYNGYYASLLAKRIECDFILCLRGSDINLAKWNVDECFFLQQSIKKAFKVVCLSEEMRDNILFDIDNKAKDKIQIIPNEFQLQEDSLEFHGFSKIIILGAASAHLNEKKGICNLIYVFKSLLDADNSHEYVLELAGDIDDDLLDFYKSLSCELNISENIKFIGFKKREELNETMKHWDIYVQTSVCEGHPNIVGEFLSLGKPILSTKTGYISDLLSAEYPYFFVDDFQIESMVSSLLSLISETELEEKIAAASKKLEVYCSPKRIQDLWLSLIQSSTIVHRFNIQHIISAALHDVDGDIHDSITTPISVFRSFVEYIYSHGYQLCSLRDFVNKSADDKHRSIVLTFDDGYESLAEKVMPILKEYGFTATVYTCTGLIGKDNSWNNKDAKHRMHLDFIGLHKLHNSGWEIGSHGVLHRNLLKLSDKEISQELAESKQLIEKEFGECLSYSYPYGAYNAFIQSCVSKHYDYACAVSSGGTSMLMDKYQIRRYSISQVYEMLEDEE